MEKEIPDPLKRVAEYYSLKLLEHGANFRGVDWNSEASQSLRFDQLSKIFQVDEEFSVLDWGCGYGSFYGYLLKHCRRFKYHGIDVSPDMIREAKQRFQNCINASFSCSNTSTQKVDYIVASGIFNVKLNCSNMTWFTHIQNTISAFASNSRRGFAFNCLTSFSDPDRMREDLYYADPCILFDLCKKTYSRNVALLHDYGLYEFTILVRT